MTRGLFGHLGDTSRKLDRREHLTFRANAAAGRHGWLRLTPAYSLGLVHELLGQSTPDDLVLDPFSGTGTTALACSALGIRCHAVDINPFLVWLGNLKLSVFPRDSAERVKKQSEVIAEQAINGDVGGWKPDLHQIDKWWDAPTLNTLSWLCAGIKNAAAHQPDDVLALLKIAFCQVMIRTASVSFGHQSMSFKKRKGDPCLIAETPDDLVRHVTESFRIAAADVAETLFVAPPIAPSQVILGDSRQLPAVVPSNAYTVVITSPPYPNRMSYIRELRPYMYWLGFLSDGRAAGELDWQAIGGTWGCATSLLNTWKPDCDQSIPFPAFNGIIHEISGRHLLLGRYVQKYFNDIKQHIAGLRSVLAPGARCHYIVGNSKFYETTLPVEKIYAALFRDTGFQEVTVETIRKRTSKKELYEFIVHAYAPLS